MKVLGFDVSVPQMRCFIAVVDAGSVAAAGRKLGMSAASVSKALTRLEEGAGVRLLHRSTHALSLTEAGEALLEPAREALRAAEAFEHAIANASGGGDSGVVRLTASAGLARHVLVPLLARFARAEPDIRIDVRVTNEIVDLAEGGIDLAIRSGSLAGLPGHVQQPWFECPWVICAAPAYLARRRAPKKIADLDDHDLIAFRNPRSGRIQPWPHRSGSASGTYDPRARLTFDDGDAVLGAMLEGSGIVCVPLYMVATALRSGAAREILAKHRDADSTMTMLRRDRRLTPKRLSKVMAFLAKNAPDLRDLR